MLNKFNPHSLTPRLQNGFNSSALYIEQTIFSINTTGMKRHNTINLNK